MALKTDYQEVMIRMKMDVDYIAEEAYKDGTKDGTKDGQNEAWEATKKVVLNPNEGGLSIEELDEIFDCCTIQQVFRRYTISEIIAKLKAYEEKQKVDDEITVGVHFGDEIVVNGERGIVVSHENEGCDTIWALLNGYRTPQIVDKNNYTKTGRHFDMTGIMEAVKNG